MGLYLQAQNLFIPKISEHDGLLFNDPKAFCEDDDGVVWMGSEFGLNAFDGSEILGYTTTNSKGLTDHNINCVAQGSDHNLWMATMKGLVCYNKLQHHFQTYYNHYQKDSAAINRITSIANDGNKLWLATEGGLVLFDTNKKTFTVILNQTHNGKLSEWDNRLTHVFIDSHHRIWLGSYNGLWQFNVASKKFTCCDNETNDAAYDMLVMDVAEDNTGQIWFGCWTRGLKKWNEGNRIESFMHLQNAPTCAASICPMQNTDGSISIWVNKSFTKFDVTTNSFTPYLDQLEGNIAADDVTKLFADKNNLLWVATNKGVFIYNEAFQFFNTKQISDAATITSQVPALFCVGDKLLVAGQGTSALQLFSSNLQLLKDYSAQVSGTNIYRAVMNWSDDPTGNWWLSTSEGLVKFNRAKNQMQAFYHKENDSTSLPSNFMNATLFYNQQLLVCPWRKGVWVLDEKTKSFQKYFHINETELPYNVSKIISDKQQQLWFADIDRGLFCYNTSNKKLFHLISSIRVSNVFEDNENIWAVTNDSVYCFNQITKSKTTYAIPAAQHRYCYDFTVTKNYLWIATHNGLLQFSKSNHSFQLFTEDNGLKDDDMGGSMASNGDTIYFLGNNYITRFYETQLNHSKKINNNVLLRAVLVNEKNITDEKQLQLKYSDRNISFHWALPDFSFPLHSTYSYKLEGINTEWISTGNSGQITFNSLAPGHYTFHYKAQTALGAESKAQIFSFDVLPPFWNTGWFISIAIIVLAVVFFFVARQRISVVKKKAALEQKMAEAEMKALRAQMNPHFIFNALNSIKGAMLGGDEFEAARYLDKFSKLIRQVLENSMSKKISLQSEINYLTLYLELESFRFQNFEFDISSTTEMDADEIKIQPMIVQPFVENAIKHGLAAKEGSKKVSVRFQLQNETTLHVTVTDNGIGRKASAIINQERNTQHHSLGMQITSQRLQTENSTENKIEFIDLADANGNASGTQVNIFIRI